MDLLDGSDPEDGGDVIDQDVENDLLGSDDDDMITGRTNMEDTYNYEEKYEEEEDTLDLGLDEQDDLGLAQVPFSEERVAPVRTVVRTVVPEPEVRPNVELNEPLRETSHDDGRNEDEQEPSSNIDLDLDDEEEEKNPRSRFHTERKTETSGSGSSSMGAPIATLGSKQKFMNSQNENKQRGNWGNNNQNFRGRPGRGPQNQGQRPNFMMRNDMVMRPRGLLGDPPMRGGGYQDFGHQRPGPNIRPQRMPIPPHHSNAPIQQFSGQIFTDFDRPMMNPNNSMAPPRPNHPIRNSRPQLNPLNQGQMQNQARNQGPRFNQRGPPSGPNPFLPVRLQHQPQNQGPRPRPPNMPIHLGPRGMNKNQNQNRPLLPPPNRHQSPIRPPHENFSPQMGESKIESVVPSHPNVIITRGHNLGVSPTKMHQGENPFLPKQSPNGSFPPQPNKTVNIPQMRNMPSQQQPPMSGPRPRQNFIPNPSMEMNSQMQHQPQPHFPPPTHPVHPDQNPFMIIGGGGGQEGMWPRPNPAPPIQIQSAQMGPGPIHQVDPMRPQFFPHQQHQGMSPDFGIVVGVPFYPDQHQPSFARPSMHVAPMEFSNQYPTQPLSQGMPNRYDGPEFHQMRDHQDIGQRQENFLDKLEQQRRERERSFTDREKKSDYREVRHADRDWDRERSYERQREWERDSRDRDRDYENDRSIREVRERPYVREEEKPFKRPNEYIPTGIPEKKRMQNRIGPPPRVADKHDQIAKIVMDTKKEMGLGLDDDYLRKLEEQKRRREEIIRQKEFNRRMQTGTKEPEGEKITRNELAKGFEQPSFPPPKPQSIHVNPRAFKGDLSLLKTNLKKINMDVKEPNLGGENRGDREVKDERVVLIKSPSKPQTNASTPAPMTKKVKLQAPAPVVPKVLVEKPKKPHTILRIVKNKKGEVISRSKVQVHLK